ncbi:hypothetical protein GCM10008949_49580 [Deinococcus humi]|nr:hypothetical protein GCM10008949_49580 [Deinococcus humi]
MKICSEIVDVPSGELQIGDLFVETYIRKSVKSLKAKITVYVDEPDYASLVDLVIQEL